MDEFLENYFETKIPRIISVYSRKSITNNLKRVVKIINIPFVDWDVNLFTIKFIDSMLEKFKDKYKTTSIISSLSILKAWLVSVDASREIIDEIAESTQDFVDERNDKIESQEKTPTEIKLNDDFEWANLTRKITLYIEEHIEKANRQEINRLLVVGLFTLQPPVRPGNYANVLVKNEDEESKLPPSHNYLIVGNGGYKFVFNLFKTAKILGQTIQHIEKNSLLEELISIQLSNMKNRDDKFFKGGQAAIASLIADTTFRIFNFPISANVIRHSYLTSYLKSVHTIPEKRAMARSIGQTYDPSMMENYFRVD